MVFVRGRRVNGDANFTLGQTTLDIDGAAALATVIGVLVEVPLMLALVAIVNRSKAWYETR